MTRAKRRALLLGVVALALICGGWSYRDYHRYRRVHVHDEGLVYRSAWVEPDVISELIDRYRLRSVVNLCAPGEMGEQRWAGERDAVFNAGAKLIELEMPVSLDPGEEGIARHLKIMSNPDNYPMLVHCQHGFTRTAKFLTMYDIVFRGMTAEESIAAQPIFSYDRMDVHVTAFASEFEKQHSTIYSNIDRSRLQILGQ